MTRSSLIAGSSDATARSGARARWQAALGMSGPFVAAALLPPVAGQVALLADPRPDVVVGAVAVLVAVAVTWLLGAWSGLVCVAVLGSRLPGFAGAVARRTLVWITPAVVRRVVVAAAGVSVAAGLAACGSPASAATPLTGPTSLAIVSSPATPSSTLALGVSVDLDWPVAAAPTEPPGEPQVTPHSAPTSTAAAAMSPKATPATSATPSPAPASATPVKSGAHASPNAAPTGTTARDAAPGPSAPTSRKPDAAPTPVPAAEAETDAASRAAAGPAAEPIAMDATSGVIVRPGDSLWSIAAAQLPAGATAHRIDATWRAWYRANRDVIGPNPNLVMPGQVLQAPPSTTALSTTR